MIVARYLNARLIKRTDARAAQLAKKVAEFEDDILARTREQLTGTRTNATFIIGRQEDHCEVHIRIVRELLDNSSTGIRLLMKDDWLQTEFLQEACCGFLHPVVVPMHHKDL